ncbi:MAG: prolyl oligopeptidase family serine peptidase [Candidatus Cloacimonadota bacterium]|nr:prolyl oligopeptidase family serine peptidase [Candidatus Cloacimonadota bacterium]
MNSRILHFFSSLLFSIFITLFFSFSLIAQSSEYMKPPQDIVDIVDAPYNPTMRISPDGKWIVLLEREKFPPLEELAEKELALAGKRINPKTNGPSRSIYYRKMQLLSMANEKKFDLKIFPDAKIEDVSWSPDSKKIAFILEKEHGLELWVAFTKSKTAKKLTDAIVNDAYYGSPFRWMPNSKTILYKSILKDRGTPPLETEVKISPTIMQNEGEEVQVRTYQSLLRNDYDVKLFKYYMTAQLNKIDLKGNQTKFGLSGIIRNYSPSPNGKYILMEITHPPFSFIVPGYRFPKSVEIWTDRGKRVKTIAELPLAEDIPISHGSCRKGRRNFEWSATAPATLFWVEAQDEGNPSLQVKYRDVVYSLEAPFEGIAKKILSLTFRYGGIDWGNDTLAISYQYSRKDRRKIVASFNPNKENAEPNVLFDRNYEDQYSDPGNFISHKNAFGKSVLVFGNTQNILYLKGDGASQKGNIPFLDIYNLKTKTAKRLWNSQAPFYERFVRFISKDKDEILIRRESKTLQPNYYLFNLDNKKLEQVTHFPHPHEQLNGIQKEMIRYKRNDGVELTATLYLPEDYQKSTETLPVYMKAYPHEYKSASAAGQVRESPYKFIWIYQWSPQLWISQGFAVLDNPAMPIIGEGDEKANDTFVEQLVADAEAAVDAVVNMGIGDPDRIIIDGHSYGAFMVANLMAHSDLFAAGIARSGAYNRTLTPFGFQHEDRTYWEVPQVYLAMSPFMYADKIEEPLLLIHGECDNNSGTFPIQSERFYHALKGNGATVRLVILPYESHSYRSRESVMHVLWEINRWLNKYVKNVNSNKGE